MMNRILKRLLPAILSVSFLFILSGCNFFVSYNSDETEIQIGIGKEYKIVFVNDLHMQINTDEIAEDQKELISARIKDFSFDGLSTEDSWRCIPQVINRMDADFVIFGGDILDYCSEANAEALKKGLSELDVPYMYLRSDHDVEPYWLKDVDLARCTELQNGIAKNDAIMWEDLGEIIILGINYSQNNISEEALNIAKTVFEMEKPIIVATHIPFDQAEEIELKEFSEEVRDGRHLYWGIEGEKYPNENTMELMNMIYSEDSPVVAVLAGHLHERWEGILSNNTIEHVFAPCYKGNIGVVICK